MMKAIDDYLSNLAYDTFVQALTHTPTINQLSGAYNADEFAELMLCKNHNIVEEKIYNK